MYFPTPQGCQIYFQTQNVRQNEIQYLYQKLPTDVPTVVLGDFNKNNSGDTFRYLGEQGLIDSLGQFDHRSNTWRWETSVINLEGRYDHILYSSQLKCYDAKVLKEGSSDHLPVVAVLGTQ